MTVTTRLQQLLLRCRDTVGTIRHREQRKAAKSTPFRPQVQRLEDRLCMSIDPLVPDDLQALETDGVQVAAETTSSAQSTATATAENFRWAATSNTIHVIGDVAVTLSDIKAFLPNAALTLVDPTLNVWYLGANLRLSEGAKLDLHGSTIGGDVDELRLRSDNTGVGLEYVEIRADWGTIDIRSTRIFSWDSAVNAPDTEYEQYGRAFIRARSSLDGETPRESRMDIADSEIGYLGFHGAESYGLSWKANVGNVALLDVVDVYGDISDSYIHHNYFGVYTYGHYGGRWTGNEVAYNVQYGIDPHDDSDSLLIENNHSHHNGNHGIIASQRCDNLTIRNNISEFNVGNGIMLHRESNDSVIEGNIVKNNSDTGIALFDSYGTTIKNNISQLNLHGIRLSVGSSDNVIEQNDFSFNTARGVNFFSGTDVPNSGLDSRPQRNRFLNNQITNNAGEGIRLRDSDYNSFEGNTISGNVKPTVFWDAVGSEMINNLFQDARLRLIGSAQVASTLALRAQSIGEFDLDEFSTATIFDPSGQIHEVVGKGVGATVTPTGASLVLDYASVGQLVTVEKRELFVSVASESATVRPILWSTSGDYRKRFEVQAESATTSITFAVGNLAALGNYNVTRNGALVGKLQADTQGRIQFTDQPGITSAVSYEVSEDSGATPQAPVLIQAEAFTRRVDGLPTGGRTTDKFRWFVIDAEKLGSGTFVGATGNSSDLIQTLRASDGANVSGKDLSQPGQTYVEYDVNIQQAGKFKLELRVAGIGSSSDSLWVDIPTGTRVGGTGPVQRSTNTSGKLEWRLAGEWTLSQGTHTIRLSMRESGTAVDALQLTPVGGSTPNPPPQQPPSNPTVPTVGSELVLEAESFQRLENGKPNAGSVADVFHWFKVPTETQGIGQFTGATGAGYIQPLRLSDGALVSGKNLTVPGTTYVEYDVIVATSGQFRLDLRAAGLSASSDSVWATITTATGGTPVNRSTNITGAFEWRTCNIWDLGVGTHTIRLAMRESGVAVDAVRLTRL